MVGSWARFSECDRTGLLFLAADLSYLKFVQAQYHFVINTTFVVLPGINSYPNLRPQMIETFFV